jgi:hypothetical protein
MRLKNNDFRCTFCFFIRVSSLPRHAFLMMIIVVELCYEVMNYYVLSRQLSFHPASCTFCLLLISLSLSLSNGVSYF